MTAIKDSKATKPISRRALKNATALGRVLTAAAAAAALSPQPADAGPKGGVVKAGSAKISTRAGKTTITQSGQKVVIDWKSFDIDSGEAVKFLQPGKGSIALNRVLDGLPTNIRGQLTANGNVWIVNQHGVTFHAGAMVDVGGLLATTADISNANFMAGNYRFDKPGAPDAKIINEGSITFGQAGLAAFVAPGVENRGVIAGSVGTVVIAGTETFAIDLAGDGMWAFTMENGADGASAKTSGRIHNPGGYILISARAAQGMVDSQISVGGVVEATSASVEGGKIVLSGDGFVEVSGELDATGTEAGSVGGSIEVTGETVHVTSTARIDASGDAGGGSIKIGGDYQGGGDLKTARGTLVSEGAEIEASAIGEVGDGGEVIVWADEITGFFGSIKATGGANAGDGGFAEVSGKEQLAFDGFVDLSAKNGLPGELLLDPTNIQIVASGGADDAEVADAIIAAGEGGAVDFTISASAILTALSGNDVQLAATNGIYQDADAGLNFATSPYTLSLTAVGGPIMLSGAVNPGAGGMTLSAGGAIETIGAINSVGDLVFTAGESITISNLLSSTMGDIDLTATMASTGTVIVNGAGDISGGSVTIQTAAGVDLGPTAARGDLIVSAATGDITDSGVVSVGGSTTVTATAGDVTLDSANVFGDGDAGDTLNIEANSVTVSTSASLTGDAPIQLGILTARTGDVSVTTSTAGQRLNGDITANGGSGAVTLIAAGMGANGGILQSAGIIDAGDLVVSAGAGNSVTLGPTANDVSTLRAYDSDDVTLKTNGAVTLRDIAIAGALDVTAAGTIDTTATLTISVGETTSLTATTGDVSISGSHAFTGAVSASGGSVSGTFSNSSTLIFGALTASSGSVDFTTTATVQLTGDVNVQAGAGPLTLSTGGLSQTSGTISASNLYLTAGANDLTLSGANTFSTLHLYSAATGYIVNTASTTIYAASADTLTLNTTGEITTAATSTITIGDLTVDTGGSDATFQDAATIDLTSIASSNVAALTVFDDANGIDLAGVSATTATITSSGGDVTDSAVNDVDTISIAAAGYDITLDAENTFGASTVNASGVNVTINEADDVVLGSIVATGSLTVSSTGGGIYDTATQTIAVTGVTDLTAASGYDIILDTAGHSFGDDISASGYDLTIASSTGDLDFAVVDIEGALDADALAGRVSNLSGTVEIGGDATITASTTINFAAAATTTVTGTANLYAADITDFATSGGVTIGTVTTTDTGDATANKITSTSGGMTLTGAISTAGASDLELASTGAVNQTGGSVTTDVLTLTAGAAGSNFTLNQTGNDAATLATTGAVAPNIAITDQNALNLAVVNGGDVDLYVGGDVAAGAGSSVTVSALYVSGGGANVSLGAAAYVDLGSIASANVGTLTVYDDNGGIDLAGAAATTATIVSSGGSITDSAVNDVETITLDAGADDIQLDAANTFGTATVNATGANVLITEADDVTLGAVTATGSLTVVSNGGGIFDTATQTISVTGATALTAAAGNDIVLDNAAHEFGFEVDASGRNITLADADALILGDIAASGTLTAAANSGSLTQTDDGVSAGGLTDLSATANIVLDDTGNDFGDLVDAAGVDITLTDLNSIKLGDIDAGGSLTVTALGGAIDDDAPTAATMDLNVTGDAKFTASTTITLDDPYNVFGGSVSLYAATATLTPTSSITLGRSILSDLNVTASGTITQSDALSITNTATFVAQSGTTNFDILLDNAGNDFNVFVATGGDVTVTDQNGVVLGAVTTNANADPAIATNAGELVVNASGTVSQQSGAILSVAGATDINAVGSSITLTESNALTGAVDAAGSDIALTNSGTLVLGDIDATGGLTAVSENAAIEDDGGAPGGPGDDVDVAGATALAASTTVALDDANNDFTLAVDASGTNVTLVDRDAILLGDVDAGGALDISATTGAITQNGDGVVSTGTATFTTANEAITLDDVDSNDFQGAVNASGSVISITDAAGDLQLGDIDATSTLTVIASDGALSQTAAAAAGDAVNAAAADLSAMGGITLDDANNDFTGAVDLNSANAISVTDANAITLNDVDSGALTVTAGGDIVDTASATIDAYGDASFLAAGSVTLNQGAHDFRQTVNASGTQVLLTDSNSITLGDIDTVGSLTVIAVAGSIDDGAETGATQDINVGAAASFTASTTILIDDLTNTFGGTVALNAATATLIASQAIDLAASATDDLSVTASGSITQSDAVSATNTATFTAQSPGATAFFDILLDDAANDFGTFVATGGDITLRDSNGVTFGNVAANQNVDATINVANAGELVVNASSSIAQDGGASLTVSGTTDINNSGSVIALGEANAFGGAVDADGSEITLRDADSITLGDIDASVSLVVTADSGAIDDGAAAGAGADVNVTGTSSFTASTTITLDDASNDFGGAVSLSGTTATVADANALILGAVDVDDLVVTASGSITQSATVDVANTATFTAQSGSVNFDILLDDAANAFGTFVATGGDITVADGSSLTLGAIDANVNADATISTNGGDLVVTASGGVDQTAVLDVEGTTSVTASGSITLGLSNLFGGAVNAAGTDILLTDADGIILGDIDAGASNSLTVTAQAGSITDDGAGAAGEDINATGTSNFSATVDIVLDDANHDFGVVNADAVDIALNDANGIELDDIDAAGDLTVTATTFIADGVSSGAADGDVNVAQTATFVAATSITLDNDFNDFVGDVNASATVITLRDANSITLADIDAGDALTVEAIGGAIDDGAAAGVGMDVDAGGEATFTASTTITLDDANNDFAGLVNADAVDVSIADANSIALGDIDATGSLTVAALGGDITDGDAGASGDDINVGAQASLSASGDIVLDDATHDFVGAVDAGANDIRLTDANNITLGDIDAAETLTVIATGQIDDGAPTALTGDVDAAGPATFSGTIITLDDPYNSFGDEVNLYGTTVTVASTGGLQLGEVDVATLTITTTGAITDTAGSRVQVDYGATLTARNGATYYDVLLDETHDFAQGAGGFFAATGGDITVVNGGGITLGAIDANVNADPTIATNGGEFVVTAAGDVDQIAATAVDVAGATDLNASGSITLGEANLFAGAVDAAGTDILLTDADGIILSDIDAGASNSLTVTAQGGSITDDGAGTGDDIDAAGDSFLTATANIVLDDANHDFGAVNADAVDISLNDINAIELADIDAGGDLTVTATMIVDGLSGGVAGADIDVTETATFVATGAISLDNGFNDFQGDVNADGDDVALRDANSITLADIDAAGSLTVEAISGAIDDGAPTAIDGDVNVAETTMLTAATSITLDDQFNDFVGAVDTDGVAVTLRDANAILLNDIDATSTLTVTASGSITQTGAETVNAGDAVFDSADATTTLTNPANTFSGTVSVTLSSDASIYANGTLTLGGVRADNATPLTNRFRSYGGDLILTGDIDLTTTAGTEDSDLSLIAQSGSITQTGGSIYGRNLDADAGVGSITLYSATNDLILVNTATGSDIALRDANSLTLGDIDASNSLTVVAVTGAIDDGAQTNDGQDVDAGGVARFVAGGDITLDDATNDFANEFNAEGLNINVGDRNALQLSAIIATETLVVTATGTISDTGGQSITVGQTATFTAADGANGFDIVLDNDTVADRHSFGGQVNAAGEDITLIAGGGVELGVVSAIGDATPDDAINVDGGAEGEDPGELTVIARGGAITDGATGSLTVTGDANFEAISDALATFDITLDNTVHRFDSDGAEAVGDGDVRPDFVTFLGALVTITDAGALNVYDSAATAGATLTAKSGDLDLERIRIDALNGPLVGVAGAGAITATDLSGGAVTLGGAGTIAGAAQAADGTVLVTNFNVDGLTVAGSGLVELEDGDAGAVLQIAGPTQSLTFVTVDAFTDGAAADFNAVTGSVADTLILERMIFDGDITIAAGEVDLGHIDADDGFFVTANTGDIAKRADADIDFTGSQTATFDVAGARGAANETLTLQTFDTLVAVGGDASLTADAGDVILTRGQNGAYKANEFVGAVSIDATDAALEDATSLQLGVVAVDDKLAVRINSDNADAAAETLTQTATGTITVGGEFAILTGLGATERSGVTLDNAGNSFVDVKAFADDLTIRGADAFRILGSDLTGDLSIGSSGAQHLGDLTLTDTRVAGDLAFDATGAVNLSRIEVQGATAQGVAGVAGGGLTATDIVAPDAVALSTTSGDLSVTDAVIGRFDFDSAAALMVTNVDTDGSYGETSTVAGQVTISNIVADADTLIESTGAGIDIDSARTGATMTLTAAGDIALGALSVGDDLNATSTGGSVAIRDAATDMPADIVADGANSATIGFESGPLVGDVADLRVNDAFGGTAGATVDPDDFTLQIFVADDSTFGAQVNVFLPREADAEGGLHNDFGGEVAISAADGDVVIEDANALTFGSVTISTGDLSARSNADNLGAGDDITQTADMSVAGTAAFVTGDHGGAAIADAGVLADVTLDRAGNDFGGDVSVVADNAALADANAISVANGRLATDLTVTTAASASADAALSDIQVGRSLTLNAGGAATLDRIVAGGDLAAESGMSSLDAADLSVSGATMLTASTTLTLDDAIVQDLTVNAGGAGRLTDVSSRVLNVHTGGVTISGLSATTTMITSTAAADIEQMSAASTTIDVTNASLSIRRTEVTGTLDADAGTGAVALADVEVSGDATIAGGAIGSDAPGGGETRLAIGGALDMDGTTVDLTDVAVSGATDLDATSDVTLDDASFAALDLKADGAITITDAAAGDATLDAGATLAATNVRVDRLDADAGQTTTLTSVQVANEADILVDTGDARLGSVDIGGSLTITATSGAVETFDGSKTLSAFTVSAPTPVALPAFTVEGPDAATIGVAIAADPETRVTETLVAVADQVQAAVNGAANADISIGAATNDRLLSVDGVTIATASTTLSFDDTDLGDATLTAGGATMLTSVEADILSVDSGGSLTISSLSADRTDIVSDGPADIEDMATTSTTITVTNMSLNARRIEAAGPLTIDAGTGDIALADVNVTDDAAISGANIGSDAAGGGETRVSVGGALDVDGSGNVALTDLDVTGATDIDAGGALSLDDVSLTALDATSGGDLTLTDGAAASTKLDSGAALSGSNLRFADLDADADAGAMFENVEIAGDADILADTGDIRIGAVEVGGALTGVATTGAITTFAADKMLDAATVSAAQDAAPPAFGASSVAPDTDVAIAASTNDRLIEVGGETALTAGGALTLDDGAIADGALASGGAMTLTSFSSADLDLDSGGATTISQLVAGVTELLSDGPADIEDVWAPDFTIRVTDQNLNLRRTAIGGDLIADAGAGDVALADVGTANRFVISGANIGSDASGGGETRLDTAGVFEFTATGDVTLTDLVAMADTTIAAGGLITLDDFDLKALDARSAAAMTLTDGRAEATTLDAGGTLTATNLRLVDLTAESAADMTLEGLSAAGDAALLSDTGDIALGVFAVDGVLTAEATNGAIATRDSGFSMPAFTITGRTGPDRPAFLGFTQTTLPDTVVGAETPTTLVSVGGDAYFLASGDVALVDDAIGVSGDNDFVGGVSVQSGGAVMINDGTDLAIGAPTDVALPGGSTLASGIVAPETLRIETGGSIFDLDTPQSTLLIDGDARFIAGGDILLDNETHVIGGSIGAEGQNVTLTETGTILLGPIEAAGDLYVEAGANNAASGGTLGDAAIRQTSSVTVDDAEAGAAPAPETTEGPISVVGSSTFTTGLQPNTRLASRQITGDRDLVLDNPDNAFGGQLNVARIAGDATIIEESAPSAGGAAPAGAGAAVRDDAAATTELIIGNFEVGGSTILTTSDAVIFRGRMTSLLDSETPTSGPSRPDTVNPRSQGDLDIADEDLRLFISTGETLTIDTTGGGLNPTGAGVRFDRPIDGDNDAPPVGTPAIAQERDGLGGLIIDAGSGGEIRFRDFVGAQNPLGDVDLRGGDIFAGFTFAEATPDFLLPGVTPDSRFLFNRNAPNDFFFADDVRVNAPGRIEFLTPFGTVDQFILDDQYFAINVSSFTFGDEIEPTTIQAFGFIGTDRTRAVGLLPVGPRDPNFQFNDCVIGDVADCTTIPIPNVVNAVLIAAPPLLGIDAEDLIELFGSFGNEELWGVPQSYYSDLGLEGDEVNEEDCPEGTDDPACDEG